jgi:hypothetical protein
MRLNLSLLNLIKLFIFEDAILFFRFLFQKELKELLVVLGLKSVLKKFLELGLDFDLAGVARD